MCEQERRIEHFNCVKNPSAYLNSAGIVNFFYNHPSIEIIKNKYQNFNFIFNTKQCFKHLNEIDHSKSSSWEISPKVIEITETEILLPTINCLTLSWRMPIPYRNQSIDLQSKSMDWFLYDIGLRNERVK